MPSTRCPVCFRQFASAGDAKMTRDHIMPRTWGGSSSFYGLGIVDRITRKMCARCNALRGATGHCVGALACALAVANDECVPANLIIRRWKFSSVPPAFGRKAMRKWIRRAGLAPPAP